MAREVTGASSFSTAQALFYGAGNLGAGMVFAFANAALPLYLASYGLPNAVIGLLAQDRPPLAGLSQVVVGFLSDRTWTRLGRRRPYIVVGVPLSAIALLALALRPPLPLMILLLLVMTTSLAVAYGPYLALLPDLVPEERRGRVGSVLTVASMIGQLSMLFLASQLWSSQEGIIFWVVAGTLAFGFGLTLVGVRETAAPLEPDGTLPLRPADYVRDLLGRREVMKYLAATLFYWLGIGGVVPFLTRFAVNELGTSESVAFQLLLIAIVSTLVFALPAGWLGDRFGKKRMLLLGLGLLGLSVLVGSQVQSVEQAIVALIVTGLANALCTVLLFPLLSDLIPGKRAGEFTGLGAAVWELAQPLGAVLAGLAADASGGSLRSSLLVAGLLTLVACALLVPVRAPERPGEADAVARDGP